jgi:membrane dipeptidase
VELAQRFIIVDGHIDVPYRMTEHTEDITQATEGGDFDYPRAKAGGLNAPFMSIYIPSARQQVPGSAKALADSLIDLVEGFVQRAPDKFAIAHSVDDVLHHDREGLVSLPMGMENGAPIETLADLRHFHARGIRYITLTHGRDNQLSDSSYDTTATWNGISPFGEQVIAEMNRLGILVDVSHLSDSAFYDVVRLTKAPVMASHSSCRAFTPGWQRNMSDDMIRRLAQNGGVIMINFGSSFLRDEYQAMGNQMEVRIRTGIAQRNLDPRGPEAYRFYNQERRANPVGTLADVVAHIDHVVQLVGIDHVGLGSDFDGVFALPKGLQDISEYPNLVYALLQRGYSEADIGKILGGNALRVWREAEQVAQALQRASGR